MEIIKCDKESGIVIKSYNKLDSTQMEIKRLINSNMYSEFECIITKCQTYGYGRKGNGWVHLKGNLALSIGYKGKVLENMVCGLLMRLSIVLTKFGVNTLIKWPNDLYISESKICGVLVEQVKEYIVIGIGMNILGDHPSYKSIKDLTGISINQIELVYEIFKEIKLFSRLEKVNIDISYIQPKYTYLNGLEYKIVDLQNDCLILKSKDSRLVKISPLHFFYDYKNNELIKRTSF
ncbi:putative biotin--[acetyl-CoA-carboxylase] ligase [Hamiltosporidium tvaerminnensis]|uniref:Putative biotin--[acetyl-CoA-carboxylase] ligase n=1 Tax=Hamiltosporidium tvaerminnensis TaxID=1176355 RepID=A0A4Q9L5D3_9MICR|nr:hypothetical protein LUQ84_002290 [Hamiltosporidium tvaerminnensis]TBU02051.1 putative biotin--[acetyl-CoA-carboxylase] ligase [Hamiltosporidium tvaerminnensis]